MPDAEPAAAYLSAGPHRDHPHPEGDDGDPFEPLVADHLELPDGRYLISYRRRIPTPDA